MMSDLPEIGWMDKINNSSISSLTFQLESKTYLEIILMLSVDLVSMSAPAQPDWLITPRITLQHRFLSQTHSLHRLGSSKLSPHWREKTTVFYFP